jgi:hypothetical protein
MEVSCRLHISAALPPEKESAVLTGQKAVWASAGLDAVEKRKITRPCQESSPARLTRSPSLYQLGHPGYPRITKILNYACAFQPLGVNPTTTVLNKKL